MKCYCHQLESFSIIFNGKYGELKGVSKCDLTFCCEHIDDIPGIALCDTAEETIERLKRLRQKLILAGQQIAEGKDKIIPVACLKCPKFQDKEAKITNDIRFVSLSMYPSPCQCKCCYCGIHGTNLTKLNKRFYEDYYMKVFEVIELMIKEKLIAPDAKWQVACGEISIHPFKDKILRLVADKKVNILTNAFVFDKNIAQILADNPKASINLSIDAGSSNTWKKIKGFDNFHDVLNNLNKYRGCSKPNQITLKYLIIPGINTSLKDLTGIIRIMKDLEVTNLIISHDFAIKPNKRFLISKVILIMLLHINGFTHEMAHF